METSIFIAKSLGLYFLIAGFLMIVGAARMKPLLMDFMNNRGMVFFSGFLDLMIGILIVVSHNVWVYDWRFTITFIGYIAIIKGINRIMAPDVVIKAFNKVAMKNHFMGVAGLITLLFGVWYAYCGFFLVA